jgi:hypothetical protein
LLRLAPMCGPGVGDGQRDQPLASRSTRDAAMAWHRRPSQHQHRPRCRSRPGSGRGPRAGTGGSVRALVVSLAPMPRPVPWWSAGTNACATPLVLRACPRQEGTLAHFRARRLRVIRAIASQPSQFRNTRRGAASASSAHGRGAPLLGPAASALEDKQSRCLTSSNAAAMALTLASAVIVCRLVLPGAGGSPPGQPQPPHRFGPAPTTPINYQRPLTRLTWPSGWSSSS